MDAVKIIRRTPFLFTLNVFALIVFSFFIMFSASIASQINFENRQNFTIFYQKQFLFFTIGLLLVLVVISINYRFYKYFIPLIYIINIIFLVLVLFIGISAGGAKRWISFGFFGFQPSEIQKIITIVSTAFILTNKNSSYFKKIGISFIFVLIPFFLILKEPDLGSALVVFGLYLVMLFIFPIKIYVFLLSGIASISLFPVFWNFLKAYQKERILTFLNPQRNPLTSGYNVLQAIIAIGSGKIFGRGLHQSTQSALNFVPVQYSDFIFSLLGEIYGFVGSCALIILYIFLFISLIKIFNEITDDAGRFIIIGIFAMWFIQAFVNIGMNLGLMPVTGIPLPFVSYGGSSLIGNMIAAGIVINIYKNRDQLSF